MSEANTPIKPKGFQRIGEKWIFYGKPCTGKTVGTTTILPCLPEGGRLIYIMTESNSPGGVEFGLQHHSIVPKPGQLFYSLARSQHGKKSDISNLIRATERHVKGETLGQKHDAQNQNLNQKDYGFLIGILKNWESLKVTDYVTGEQVNLGNISDLTENDVVVIDGLTAIAKEVWNICFGDVIIHTMYDYGPVQRYLANIFAAIERFTCGVILLAHEKEYDKPDPNSKTNGMILDFVGPDTLCGSANFSVLMSSWAYVIRTNKHSGKYVWQVGQQNMFSANREKIQPFMDEKNPKNSVKLEQLVPDFRKYNFLGVK